MYKKYFIKGLILSIILTLATACSSDIKEDDIGSSISQEDGNYIQVEEGTKNVITLLTNSNLILSGNDANKFTVSGSSLMFKNTPDYERDKRKYYITLNNEKFIITLLDLNDNAPIFKSDDNISIQENRTSVMELEATDADSNTTVIYSIKENNEDGTLFELDDNQITFKDAPDYELKSLYKFTAVATDGVHTTEQLITVNIEDVADITPTLENFTLIVSEDSESNITIGNLNIIDKGDTNISSMFLSGDGNDTFNISLDGNLSILSGKKLNYDPNGGKQSYQFKLIATNEAGDSNATDVNISILNVIDEVPVLLNLNTSIKENASKNTQIGPITRVYEGDTPIRSIRLVGDGKNLFNVDTHGYISLKEENILDYETKSYYAFKAIAKNEAGEGEGVDVNITIEDYINKPFQIAKITNSSTQKSSAFGNAVAMNGDYIVVGAYEEDTQYKNAGTAYIYKKSLNGEFFEVAKIEADDTSKGDGFAKSVAIYGDYIAIGSPLQNNKEGATYLFQKVSDTTVNQKYKIEASDTSRGDMFGESVAMTDKYVLVSAPQADIEKDGTTYSKAGAVYLYTISSSGSLVDEIKISANSPKQDDEFGTSIAIFGDYIVISSPNKDSLDENDIGYVYLFKIEENEVIQKGAFQADDATGYAYFGSSISIDNSYILVGAKGDNSKTTGAGSTYLFKKDSNNNITQIAKFYADDSKQNDAFGKSVSIDGNYMVVSNSTGSIYTFKKEADNDNNITQIIKNEAFDTETDDGFGTSIFIDGDYIVVGAYKKGSRASNNQSVYLFYMEPLSQPHIYNKTAYISYDEPFTQHNLKNFQANSPDGRTITFSVDGTDSNSFSFSETALKFNEKANYELLSSSNSETKEPIEYNLKITAQDSNNQSTDFDLKIDLNNREYLDLETLLPDDIQNNDEFSNAIAISGEYIVVSSSKKQKAYLYKKDSNAKIIFLTSFQADNNEDSTNFGISLSIDSNYIVVGANKKDAEDEDVGAVYLFHIENDDVTQIKELIADDNAENDNFGTSVSISGNYIAIGSPKDDVNDVQNTGSAYLFQIDNDDDNNITQVTKFIANNAGEKDYFGTSISISGKYIIVGSPKEDTTADNAGSSYLFKIDNDDITQIGKIQASTPEKDDDFGNAVSIDGDYFIVGAKGKESNKGKSYLFKRDSDSNNDITLIEELSIENSSSDDNFGTSVSINNDIIVIGATGEDMKKDINITDSGSVYIFEKSFNEENNESKVEFIEKIKAYNTQNSDNFGVSVGIDGDFIVAGATGKEQNSGAGYIFIKDEE